MSDFLKKFSNDNYKDMVKNKKQTDKTTEETVEIEIIKEEEKEEMIKAISSKKSKPTIVVSDEKVEEDTVLIKKATIDKEETKRSEFEEEVVIDQHYHKKKIIQYSIIGAIGLFLCIAVFLLFRFTNQVTMPDFVNENVSSVQTWAVKNKIELKIEREYSLDYEYNIVFEQSKKANKKIQKGSVLTIKVSDGADPDELIKLPDFTTMTKSEIESWKIKNKAENLKIVTEYSEEIEKDKVIKFEIKDTSITSETYRRKDIATVYVSKGQEAYEKNIVVPNFTNKSKAEVEEWAKKNEIVVTYNESDSDSVLEGCIISQSITADEKIAKKTEMSVYVSIGKATIVPNFVNYSLKEVESYIDGSGLNVVVTRRYHDSISYGGFISQSIGSGTKLYGTSNTVTVVYSIGRPFIGDLTTILENENGLQSYFYEEYQSKGANITYSVNYVDSIEGTKGKVVSSNYNNEFVGMNTHVSINIGKGNLPAPPSQEE